MNEVFNLVSALISSVAAIVIYTYAVHLFFNKGLSLTKVEKSVLLAAMIYFGLTILVDLVVARYIYIGGNV